MRSRFRTRFNISNYSNLKQRVITAVVGAAVIIFGCMWSEWAYLVIFGTILGFSQMEFYKLCGLDGMLPLKSFGTLIGVAIFIFTFLEEMKILPKEYYYLVFPLLSMIFFIRLYGKTDKKPFTGIAFTLLGIVYVAIPFSILNLIAFSADGTFRYELIIGSLLILWASDSGAYFAGTKFGKTKLFERVSPKKSWEGSLGGAFAALVTAYFISQHYPVLPQWQWFGIMIIIVVAGT